MGIKQINIATPEQVTLNYKLAGLGSRSAAILLDYLIISTSIIALGSAFIYVRDYIIHANYDLDPTYVVAILSSIILFVCAIYFVLFEFFASGQTIGKKVVGIKVIQDNGQALTFLASAVRNLLRIIDFMPGLYMVGNLMLLFHPQHKRLGDLASGTVVVYQSKAKRTKKIPHYEHEIDLFLTLNPPRLVYDEGSLKRFGSSEWLILRTWVIRRMNLSVVERKEITQNVAAIIYPLLGFGYTLQPIQDIESTLFTIYRALKPDWEY